MKTISTALVNLRFHLRWSRKLKLPVRPSSHRHLLLLFSVFVVLDSPFLRIQKTIDSSFGFLFSRSEPFPLSPPWIGGRRRRVTSSPTPIPLLLPPTPPIPRFFFFFLKGRINDCMQIENAIWGSFFFPVDILISLWLNIVLFQHRRIMHTLCLCFGACCDGESNARSRFDLSVLCWIVWSRFPRVIYSNAYCFWSTIFSPAVVS